MSEFASLEDALDGHFNKALADLPEQVREHPGMRAPAAGQLDHRAFGVWPWDGLSPDHRRQVARQWDSNNDPASPPAAAAIWNLQVKSVDLQRDIASWEIMAAHTPTDRIAKESRIASLRLELAEVETALQAIDSAPTRPGRGIKGERECQMELEALMRANQNPPDTKASYRSRLCNQYGISIRSFDRAWANAATATENTAWSRAGRRRVGHDS